MYSSDDSSSSSVEDDRRHLHLKYMKLVAAATVANIVTTAAIICTEPLYNKIPYHDSALTGAAWVLELLNGHPECIHNELGVHKNVFNTLIEELELAGYVSSKHVYLKEQLVIFLYTCVTSDEPPHQIRSYTLLFSLFLRFPYIADPLLHTSAPTQPHVIALARQSHSLI